VAALVIVTELKLDRARLAAAVAHLALDVGLASAGFEMASGHLDRFSVKQQEEYARGESYRASQDD
jgi:peptidyl-tRNA hydrolase